MSIDSWIAELEPVLGKLADIRRESRARRSDLNARDFPAGDQLELALALIARGSTIGANVWIEQDVPPGSFVRQAEPTIVTARDFSGQRLFA